MIVTAVILAGAGIVSLLVQVAPAQAAIPALTGHQQFMTPKARVLTPGPRFYVVRYGDTLSSISRRIYGSTRFWPSLWWNNREKVRNPDVIAVGMRLRLSSWHTASAVFYRKALKAMPPPQVPAVDHVTQASLPAYTAPAVQQSTADVPDSGGSLMDCIISHESGGNPQIVNASGHWGLFQFAYGTWVGYGGPPGEFGNASAAEQEAIYENVAAAGDQAIYDAWESDGCPQEFGLDAVSAVKIITTALVKTARSVATMRSEAMAWALRQHHKPYIWGGTGPYGFDCSGLVYAAYKAIGISIPRTTYSMLDAAGSILIRVAHPVRGDLAFYGSGHVELWWKPDWTYGAEKPGTSVGYHRYWPGTSWAPTEYFEIV